MEDRGLVGHLLEPQEITIINAITSGKFSIIKVTSLISIRVANYGGRRRGTKKEINDKCIFKIARNYFDSLLMRDSGMMHDLKNLVYYKGNVRTCESKILKTPNSIAV